MPSSDTKPINTSGCCVLGASQSYATAPTARNIVEPRQPAREHPIRFEVNLRDANLQGANLVDANLQNAYLVGANFSNANLQGANLEEANLKGTNFQGANLEGTCLANTNLSQIPLLDNNQLEHQEMTR